MDNDRIALESAHARIRELEAEAAAQIEVTAAIIGDLEAQRDAAIQRAEIAERKVREYEHAEAQVEDGL